MSYAPLKEPQLSEAVHMTVGLTVYGAQLIEQARRANRLMSAAVALIGDLDASEEQPTHFASWFILKDAIIAYRGELGDEG